MFLTPISNCYYFLQRYFFLNYVPNVFLFVVRNGGMVVLSYYICISFAARPTSLTAKNIYYLCRNILPFNITLKLLNLIKICLKFLYK